MADMPSGRPVETGAASEPTLWMVFSASGATVMVYFDREGAETGCQEQDRRRPEYGPWRVVEYVPASALRASNERAAGLEQRPTVEEYRRLATEHAKMEDGLIAIGSVLGMADDGYEILDDVEVAVAIIHDRLLPAESRATQLERDLEIAAGELLVPIPMPGSDMSRLLSANVLMRRERDEETARLDWLEGEATNDHARALFRRNVPITRAAIDASRAARSSPPAGTMPASLCTFPECECPGDAPLCPDYKSNPFSGPPAGTETSEEN